jgi:hypothetical protein
MLNKKLNRLCCLAIQTKQSDEATCFCRRIASVKRLKVCNVKKKMVRPELLYMRFIVQ